MASLSTCLLILLCGFPWAANAGHEGDKSCTSDSDCEKYMYCSSKKKCIYYGKDHCYYHSCGVGDGDCDKHYDWMGCASGLVCGTDNCAKYHQIGTSTGFNTGSDCCEPAGAGHGSCSSDSQCAQGKYCSSKKVCISYSRDHCYYHSCGMGDGDCDRYHHSAYYYYYYYGYSYYGSSSSAGCGDGLVCGKDNCAKFHTIGAATGFTSGSDCCEKSESKRKGACSSDSDCAHGHYCTSKKACAKYSRHHCYYHKCGLGDGDCDPHYDWKGCGDGLVCGQNNCAKYHNLGSATGFSSGSDCCEPGTKRHFTGYYMQKQASGAINGTRDNSDKVDSSTKCSLLVGIATTIATGWMIFW